MSLIPPGAKNDPINHIEWVDAEDLHANHWNPNRVFKIELALLERSLLSTGWIQPILANTNRMVIDGFHRWRLSQDSDAMQQRYKGKLPVAFLDVPDDVAMAITVRINRAKGSHSAVSMSALAHDLVMVHGWSKKRLADEIGATIDEVELLLCDDIFERKKIQHWAYSEAWYPTPSGQKATKLEATFGGYGDTGIGNQGDAEAAGLLNE